MEKLRAFLREYRAFSFALVTTLLAAGLAILGQSAASHIVLAVVAILEALVLLSGMWKDVRSGKYGIDILAITAIVSAVLLQEYWAAIVVVLMLTGGESLENYAHNRAKSELDALLKHAPRKATVIRKGKTLIVKVSELHVGDKLIIKPGEVVPVDAVIIEGAADFDEASLTGESLPQAKDKGDSLMSGSINLDGAVTAKATATAEDSQYQQIIKLVRGAAASQAPFTRLAERYSLPFTFLAYSIGATVWVISGDAVRFLEVIIVATPCPLLLAAPIALISGMARSSRYGVIVKTGAALEKLAEARTIAFDKTGTLTKGELVVDKVTAFGLAKKDDVLSLAASLEQHSNHVVAHAIVAAAQQQNLKLPKAKNVKEFSGRGVQTTHKGADVLVGRMSLLQSHNVAIPAAVTSKKASQTSVYIAVDGALIGSISFKDEIRPEAAETLKQLRAGGIRDLLLVTGDNQSTAEAVGKQLGIAHIHADALPADKLHILEKVKARPLVFVGDGVNDAPILTSSDVGIALGARGSTAAGEAADMVIMLDDVSRVATAYEIAKRTFAIAKQSIFIGIGLSIVLMAAFATGKFSALTGALLQEVVDVFVIFNALRAHTIRPETSDAI